MVDENHPMFIEFEHLKEKASAQSSPEEQLQCLVTLKELKNELIGSQDIKQAYFDRGLFETLASMIHLKEDTIASTAAQTQSSAILIEALQVINCFFFDFPQAKECFHIYKQHFKDAFAELFKSNKFTSEQRKKLDIVCLRVLRNMLAQKCLVASELTKMKIQIIERVKAISRQKTYLSLAAEVIHHLFTDSNSSDGNYEDEQSGLFEHDSTRALLSLFLKNITLLATSISEECLLNCLHAVGALTLHNLNFKLMVLRDKDGAFERVVSSYMRYPLDSFKVASAQIICNVHSVGGLDSQRGNQVLRWTLIQTIQMLSNFSSHPATQSSPTLNILLNMISSLTQTSKSLQKVAFDQQIVDIVAQLVPEQKKLPAAESAGDGEREVRVSLVYCLAAVTDKLESAREKVVLDKILLTEIQDALKQTVDSELRLAACVLLTSLGRTDRVKKGIIVSDFKDFYKDLGQVLLDSTKDLPSKSDFRALQMQTACLKVIANFSFDFKQFLFVSGVLERLVQILKDAKNSLSSDQYRQRETTARQEVVRSAMFCIKNLGYECTETQQMELSKVVTHEFLYGILDDPCLCRSPLNLQDQVLLMLRQKLTASKVSTVKSLAAHDSFFTRMQELYVNSEPSSTKIQVLYVLANIASLKKEKKKIVNFAQQVNLVEQIVSDVGYGDVSIEQRMAAFNLIQNLATCLRPISPTMKRDRTESSEINATEVQEVEINVKLVNQAEASDQKTPEAKKEQVKSQINTKSKEDKVRQFFLQTKVVEKLEKMLPEQSERVLKDEIKMTIRVIRSHLTSIAVVEATNMSRS